MHFAKVIRSTRTLVRASIVWQLVAFVSRLNIVFLLKPIESILLTYLPVSQFHAVLFSTYATQKQTKHDAEHEKCIKYNCTQEKLRWLVLFFTFVHRIKSCWREIDTSIQFDCCLWCLYEKNMKRDFFSAWKTQNTNYSIAMHNLWVNVWSF